MKTLGSIIAVSFFTVACGVGQPRYVNYKKSPPPTQDSEACNEASAVYLSSGVAEMVNSRCTSCHATGMGAGALKLTDGTDMNNAVALAAASTHGAASLYEYIAQHPGKAAIQGVSQEAFEGWLTSQNNCR